MSKHWRYALIGALTFTATISQADSGNHSLSDIASTAALTMQSRAADQGYQHIDVQVRPLDARLALARCTRALEALPSNSERALGAVSVGIRCPGEEVWTLYVRGEVSANQVIPVLTGALRRGDLIGNNDIVLEKRRITQEYGGIVTEIDILNAINDGKELSRTTAGDIMTPEVVSANPDTPITEMIKMMEEFHIIRLPVVQDNKLIGVVSRGDIIRNLVEPEFMSNM